MESFSGHWNESPRLPESPEKGLRQLAREELSEVLQYSRNELTVEMALKGLEKLDIKDEVDRMWRYRNDPTIRQQKKLLGSLVVYEGVSHLTYDDPTMGLTIKKGEPYIDLHIPPLEEAQKGREAIRRSFQLVAEYIQFHDLPGEYVMGVTHQKLARISTLFGFKVVAINMPSEMTRGVERVYDRFRRYYGTNFELGEFCLCYQKKQDFLSRFKK